MSHIILSFVRLLTINQLNKSQENNDVFFTNCLTCAELKAYFIEASQTFSTGDYFELVGLKVSEVTAFLAFLAVENKATKS